MDKKQLIGNTPAEETKETPEKVKAMIAAYSFVRSNAENSKERLNMLMQRKSAKDWDAAKKAKMVRRYMTANQTIDEASETIEGLVQRLAEVS